MKFTKSKKQTKCTRSSAKNAVHIRTKKGLTKAQFHALCVDLVQRKAYPNKQRIREDATRRLWHHLVPDKMNQPTMKTLSKNALAILDRVLAAQITASDLPFYQDDEKEWRLQEGVPQRAPALWKVDSIVAVVKENNKPDMYEVKWANTVEPAAFIPAPMIKAFERMRVEKAYIEAEAMETN